MGTLMSLLKIPANTLACRDLPVSVSHNIGKQAGRQQEKRKDSYAGSLPSYGLPGSQETNCPEGSRLLRPPGGSLIHFALPDRREWKAVGSVGASAIQRSCEETEAQVLVGVRRRVRVAVGRRAVLGLVVPASAPVDPGRASRLLTNPGIAFACKNAKRSPLRRHGTISLEPGCVGKGE